MVGARRFWLVLLAVALLGAVGCGGSDDNADVGTDSSDASDTESSDPTDGGDADAVFADEDCDFFMEALANNPLAGAGAEAEDFDFSELGTSFRQIADNAPDELSDDFELLADFYVEYGPLMQRFLASGGQPDAETMAEFEEMSQNIDQAKFAEASTNISTYFQEECGAGAVN